jgi:hypothetical protein
VTNKNIKNKNGSNKENEKKKEINNGKGTVDLGSGGRGGNLGAEHRNPSSRERLTLATSDADVEFH